MRMPTQRLPRYTLFYEAGNGWRWLFDDMGRSIKILTGGPARVGAVQPLTLDFGCGCYLIAQTEK